MDSLKELSEKIEAFNEERDWDQFHSPANLAKSISIEANELWSATPHIKLIRMLRSSAILPSKYRTRTSESSPVHICTIMIIGM